MIQTILTSILILLNITPSLSTQPAAVPVSQKTAQSISLSSITRVTPTPKSSILQGLKMNSKIINLTVMAGTSSTAFDLTSTGATGFTLFGYPTDFGPGINWLPSSGGIRKGSTIPINIEVNSGIAPGIYRGIGKVISYPSQTFVEFSVTVTVIANPNGPSIQILTPNGGEILQVGTTHRITWSSTNVDKVSIGYKSCDSCLSWIASNISNNNYYDWYVNVGNTTNTQFRISLTGYKTGTGSSTDLSDMTFTVLPILPTPTPTSLPTPTPTSIPTSTPTPVPTLFISSADAHFCSPDSSCYPYLTNIDVRGYGFGLNSRVRLTQISTGSFFYGKYIGGDGATRILTDFIYLPYCQNYYVTVYGSTGTVSAQNTIRTLCF